MQLRVGKESCMKHGTAVQDRLAHADQAYCEGKKLGMLVTTVAADLDCSGRAPPVLCVDECDVVTPYHPSIDSSLTSEMLAEVCNLGAHADHKEDANIGARIFRNANLGLQLWFHETNNSTALVLSNIASALLRLRHYELALCYAVAATRLAPKPSAKALYRAAYAAAALHEARVALFFLHQVHFVKKVIVDVLC